MCPASATDFFRFSRWKVVQLIKNKKQTKNQPPPFPSIVPLPSTETHSERMSLLGGLLMASCGWSSIVRQKEHLERQSEIASVFS